MSTIRIAANPTTARLFDADEDAKLEVHRLLSYNVSGAQHMPGFGSGWDGKASFLNFDKGTFPAGFIHLVTAGLRKKGYNVQLMRKPLPAPLGPAMPDVDGMGYSERYDYQPNAVRELLRHGQITARVATGGGKSRIARIAMAWINRPTLFLTTRSILMHQMHRSLEQMTGGAVAILGDGEWGLPYKREDGSPGRRLSKFCVGMVQTLSQRLEDPDTTSFPADQERQLARQRAAMAVLEKFEFVILEEAHECSSDQFWRVMMACRNAAYRLALTATPFMKDDEEANMRLLGCSGPVAVTISEQLLIERGILARPYFKFIKLKAENKPRRLYNTTAFQGAYKFGIVENEDRNRRIAAETARMVSYGMTGMLLVQHKEHGRILADLLARLGIRCEFIFGESSKGKRQKAIEQLAAGAIDVLIGSTILDVGVDVPAVGFIGLCGGGKAEVGTRQRIGRGLREKKNGMPNVAFIFDVADDFNTHLRKHAAERRQIITTTPGFMENVVEDFDFAGLGFLKKAA